MEFKFCDTVRVTINNKWEVIHLRKLHTHTCIHTEERWGKEECVDDTTHFNV